MTRIVGNPEPGFFKGRYVKGGAYIPARIFRPDPVDPVTGEAIDRFPPLHVQIGLNDPTGEWSEILRVWEGWEFVDETEYDFLMTDSDWAREHAPNDPRNNPDQAQDLRNMEPAF